MVARQDCICNVCDLLRFHAYAQRCGPELGYTLDDDSPRMKLIFDIHSTIALRHPLGISERLYEVIGQLHAAEPPGDEDARAMLLEMSNDEKESLVVNPREFEACAEMCPVAAKCEKNRSLIP